MKSYINQPEPGFLYLEPMYHGEKGPKGMILKVVRAGADEEMETATGTKPSPMRFQEGDLVTINFKGAHATPRGALCHQRFVISRVVETDGECEFTLRKGSQIALVDPQTAAAMAKGHVRLDG